MKEAVAACMLFVIAAVAFFLSIRSFREKGFLLNNTYLYASPEARKTMDKKPLYRQTAIVFLLIGCVFLLNGISLLLGKDLISYAAVALVVVTMVYAVASSAAMGKGTQ